jgi:spermidine synthase
VRYPQSLVEVVEIDPAVTEAVHQAMALPRDTTIRSIHQDARLVLRHLPSDRRYDLIYGDAFNGFSVPWHLTTKEMAADIRRALKAHGAYVLNLVDSQASQRFVAASYLTLRSVFAQVAVFGMAGDQTRETYLLVASDAEHDLGDLRDPEGRPLRGYRFDPARLAALEANVGGLVLSDDFAPVDQLTAPIYQHRRTF